MIVIMTNNRTITRTVLTLIIALTAVAQPSSADARELHLSYEANWGGLHVADFSLSLINGGDTFENRFHLETRGLTRYFTKMSVNANSVGRIVSPPPPQDANDSVGNAASDALTETFVSAQYRTEYTNKRHFRWVDIAFGEDGTPAQASTGTAPVKGRESNWNPAEKGPEILKRVKEQYRIGVNDPITMVPQMMAMVRAHLQGGPASTIAKGFDGHRRFNMDVTYQGLATRTVGRVKHDTYHVRIVPRPVAGFKKRHKTLWNNASYDFYLSRDGDFVPLQIVPVSHGPVLTLVAQCKTECEIKAEVE